MNNDLISRDEALRMLKFKKNWCYGSGSMEDIDRVMEDIKNLPAVDAEPVRHGRWIHCNGKSNLWYCSECGEKILYNQTRRTYNIEKRPVHEVNKYCRGCGENMDGGNNNGICEKS
mgnify:CR=1 FL=1